MRKNAVALVIGFALALSTAAPATAIVYGEVDTRNRFPNVGALIDEFRGGMFVICSGTLIASNIFLTAAHCVDDGTRMWVSFDRKIHEPVSSDTNTIYSGIAHAHPRFACCGANDTFDIAVVVLDEEVRGISPAPLPTENQLAETPKAELRSANFVAAGYGTVRDTRRGAHQPLYWDPQRRFAEQSFMSLLPAWLNLSMNEARDDGGTCYGDSGGPHFLNGVVVSITVTGDVWCKATDKTYRIDTPAARAFLERFVNVP